MTRPRPASTRRSRPRWPARWRSAHAPRACLACLSVSATSTACGTRPFCRTRALVRARRGFASVAITAGRLTRAPLAWMYIHDSGPMPGAGERQFCDVVVGRARCVQHGQLHCRLLGIAEALVRQQRLGVGVADVHTYAMCRAGKQGAVYDRCSRPPWTHGRAPALERAHEPRSRAPPRRRASRPLPPQWRAPPASWERARPATRARRSATARWRAPGSTSSPDPPLAHVSASTHHAVRFCYALTHSEGVWRARMGLWQS